MPRSDDLKNRLDELFSSMPLAEPDVAAVTKRATPSGLRPTPGTSSQSTEVMQATGDTLLLNAFQGAFESVSVGMILTSLEGRLMKVNDAFCQMLGYERAELEGVNFQRLTHPDDLKVGAETMRAMLSGATRAARIEKRYMHKDGTVVWVELNITLMLDLDGRPSHFVTVALDVTQQRATASMLEKRVQELNCLNDIGHMVDQRPELEHLFEWIVKRIPAAFQHPETCFAAVEYQGRIFGEAQAVDSSSKIVNGLRVKGEVVGWLHVAYTEPRHFVDAESALMGAIVSRISGYLESLQLQEDLTQRADLMVAIMDATPDWIFVKDREHRFLSVNQSFASALQRNKQDFYGKNDLEMGFPEETVMGDPAKGIQGYWWDDERVLQTGEAQSILGEKNYLGGKLHYFDVFKTVIRDGAGQIIGLLGYARDVTDQTSLISEVRSYAEREQALREITTRVRSTSDVDSILRIAVREVGDLLGRKTYIRLTSSGEEMSLKQSNHIGGQFGGNGRKSLLTGGEQ